MKPLKDKIEKLNKEIDLNNIKCPICGNPINTMTLDRSYNREDEKCDVFYICKCWSGDISRIEPVHVFRLKIFGVIEVEVDLNE